MSSADTLSDGIYNSDLEKPFSSSFLTHNVKFLTGRSALGEAFQLVVIVVDVFESTLNPCGFGGTATKKDQLAYHYIMKVVTNLNMF